MYGFIGQCMCRRSRCRLVASARHGRSLKARRPAVSVGGSGSPAAAPARRGSPTAAVKKCTWAPAGARPPVAVREGLPLLNTITIGGKARHVARGAETVHIKDYGEARQLTLFEHGQVALQILTSDFEACPAEILSWLKSRWRKENFLKYASDNYGTGKI